MDCAYPLATAMRRNQIDAKRSRLWVARLKNSLSVERPIAGDQLRTIKRHLATRANKLPCLFLSERKGPLTRQAVNYIGHRDPKHTAHYARVAGHRFKGLWR